VLIAHGFSVTILEGRDRIGGRVHSFELPSGQSVDLGPNWVHGTDNNPILDLARETNTPVHSWHEQSNIFDEDGKILADAKLLSDKMWGIILQAFKYSAENSSTINPELSLHEYVFASYTNYSRDIASGPTLMYN
jgi:monoamine oxidase